MEIQLVDYEKGGGAENMAADMALLEGGVDGIYLRPYGWEPGDWVSLGYRQGWQEFEGHQVCRRPSGGGVVFHKLGLESTYSLVVMGEALNYFPSKSKEIYCDVHKKLNLALGDKYNLCGEVKESWGSNYCFDEAGGVLGDLFEGGKKIAGAAIKRTRRGVLLQGSIALGEVDFTKLAKLMGTVKEVEYPKELIGLRQEWTQKMSTPQWTRKA